jgi:DNA transformation protein
MAKPKSNDFVTYVLDMLAPLGRVTSRAMFGGHNVALDGLTFGIIIGDVLFLKTDAENRPAFASLGLEPFSYQKKSGEVTAMSYFAAPDCLDDWDALEPYARGALAAAKRAKVPKPKRPAAKKPAAKPAPKGTAKRR